MCRGAGGLASVALNPHAAGHHVFRNSGAHIAIYCDMRFLIHTAAIISGMTFDLDHYGMRQTDGECMPPTRVCNLKLGLAIIALTHLQTTVQGTDLDRV